MSPPSPRGRRPTGYRVVCYQVDADGERILMDATGEGFIAAVGTITAGRMAGEIGGGGPADLHGHIALMIANDAGIGATPPRRRSPR